MMLSRPLWSLSLVFAAILGSVNPAAHAADAAGKIASAYGSVWISTAAENPWRRIYRGDLFYPGDEIRTDPSSGVSMVLEDESLVRLGANSNFVAEEVSVSSFWRAATALVRQAASAVRSTFRLKKGRLWLRNNNRNQSARVHTSAATFGIRGTEITIEADGERSVAEVQEGFLSAQNDLGQITVGNGQRVVAQVDREMGRSTVVRQRDSVQWTVAIPPIVDIQSLLTGSVTPDQARNLAGLFERHEYEAMNRIIERQDDDDNWFLLAAWVDLHSGESRRAYDNLLQRIDRPAASPRIRELAAFAAIINDDAEQAQNILDSLNAERLSTNGYVIRGYLQQSQFDLPAAIDSYRQALRIDADNRIARLQLARVLFGSDDNRQAQLEVQRVLRDDGSNLSAITLEGFIQLANLENAAALETWETAGDRASDEIFFGRSIAYMRQGRIAEAFESIATAVVLNPQQSIYLSYWGKMLYQAERYDKALTVLDSAIRLDGNDPTPHLYRAIILRELNRPVDAIEHLQTAIRLNDNKGVYRSRSLLDKDLAVQNVDLSRLFNQLGLSTWAQSKATASIKADYTNVSAHILNAGAFAELADYSYPLLSAALLARLMQPANTNAFSSFNDYTSMFEAPGTGHLLELGGGNHGQESLAYISYGANPATHTAWSFAAVHEDSDGWRDDNGESFDNVSLIGKWQPDRDNNFLVTASVFETGIENDLFPRFEIDAESDGLASLESTSVQLEFGLHRRISHGHDLLAHLSILDVEGDATDNVVDQEIQVGPDTLTQERIVDGSFERPLTQLQLQGLVKSRNHQVFYGLLAFDGKEAIDVSEDFGLFDPGGALIDPLVTLDGQTDNDLDISFQGAYLQDSWQVTDTLLVDLAVYYETIDNANALTGGEWTIDETSPRLGLAWNASPGHTLRLAAFQYLLPFVSARLDPIDVAGVPIFKNTNEGSLVEEADLVWEYEWPRGQITANLYKLEEEFTSAVPISGRQVESTRESEKEGARVTGNWLVGRRSGLAVELEAFEVSDESLPEYDRDESRLALSFSQVFRNGFSYTVSEILRELEFDSGRDAESIDVTNLEMLYEFDRKQQSVTFEVVNLFDEEFDWVTDEFVTNGIPPARLFMGRYTISF